MFLNYDITMSLTVFGCKPLIFLKMLFVISFPACLFLSSLNNDDTVTECHGSDRSVIGLKSKSAPIPGENFEFSRFTYMSKILNKSFLFTEVELESTTSVRPFDSQHWEVEYFVASDAR